LRFRSTKSEFDPKPFGWRSSSPTSVGTERFHLSTARLPRRERDLSQTPSFSCTWPEILPLKQDRRHPQTWHAIEARQCRCQRQRQESRLCFLDDCYPLLASTPGGVQQGVSLDETEDARALGSSWASSTLAKVSLCRLSETLTARLRICIAGSRGQRQRRWKLMARLARADFFVNITITRE
jgi:hypothetical protein